VQKALVVEFSLYQIVSDHIKRYFEIVIEEYRSILSLFVTDIDETQADLPRKAQFPNLIVTASTKPDTVTVAEEKDDTQMTFISTSSGFGDSSFPMFISKNKTFDKTLLEAQKLFERHDCTVRTA
jgi:hypothetical protein